MSHRITKAICPTYNRSIHVSLLTTIALVLLFLVSPGIVSAADDSATADQYDRKKALATSQGALKRTIGSYSFLDQDKQAVDITEYRGKPLLISLIYTSCHHICPTLTKNLAGVVEIAREALGDDSFAVVTIGFDTAADTPERMRMYARERNIDLNNWDFLSTDKDTIEAFSKDLGFIFFKSAKGFDHLSQVTLLDADGVVYRQIYGVKYEPPQLVEPLKELIFDNRRETNMVTGWINNIRLFCTIYDPHSGRYEFDYSIFISIFMGIAILGAIAAFTVREWRRNNAKRTS